MRELRRKTFNILNAESAAGMAGSMFALFLTAMITLNVVAVALDTVDSISARHHVLFRTFEVVSIVVFSIEYLLRLWSCTSDARFAAPVAGRVSFALTPMALVDLLAVAPFYFPLLLPMDLRFLRILRLFRLVRVLKIGRYHESSVTVARVVHAKRGELLGVIFALGLLLVLSSSVMYYVENEAQPQVFSSIPAAMWWGLVTLTTVGYGDIYPITALGKMIAGIISILGIGLFALPAAILASGFAERARQHPANPIICPHCGGHIKDHTG